jgi:sigmaK-factor processing regulatory protein BofA
MHTKNLLGFVALTLFLAQAVNAAVLNPGSAVLLDTTFGYFASEIIVVLAFLLILYIILAIGEPILALILNSILGLIAIYLVNVLFGLGIIYNVLTLILVAIFGLPAVAVIILLKLIGISIPAL